MMLSRDMIQGFIDGYITAGGDPSAIDSSVAQYLEKHPIYQTSPEVQAAITGDLATYRVTPQEALAPVAVPVIVSAPAVAPAS